MSEPMTTTPAPADAALRPLDRQETWQPLLDVAQDLLEWFEREYDDNNEPTEARHLRAAIAAATERAEGQGDKGTGRQGESDA